MKKGIAFATRLDAHDFHIWSVGKSQNSEIAHVGAQIDYLCIGSDANAVFGQVNIANPNLANTRQYADACHQSFCVLPLHGEWPVAHGSVGRLKTALATAFAKGANNVPQPPECDTRPANSRQTDRIAGSRRDKFS